MAFIKTQGAFLLNTSGYLTGMRCLLYLVILCIHLCPNGGAAEPMHRGSGGGCPGISVAVLDPCPPHLPLPFSTSHVPIKPLMPFPKTERKW